jgi:branched-chain amino acid aminotransferase
MKNGKIRLESYHWHRLSSGLRLLGYNGDLDAQSLSSEILSQAQKNNCADLSRVRLIANLSADKLQCTIECSPIESKLLELNSHGLNLTIATGLLKEPDTYAKLKSCNRGLYDCAYKIATERGKDDALILNTRGNIIETTVANIFWIEKDTIYTPPLSEGCVAGVMRRFLLEKLREKNIPVVEKPLTNELLAQADGLFSTNALRGVKWIGSVDAHIYSLHPLIVLCSEIVAAE